MRLDLPWHLVEKLDLYDVMRELTYVIGKEQDQAALSVYVSLRRMTMLATALPHDDRCMPLHLSQGAAATLADYAAQRGGPWTQLAEIIYHDIAEEARNEETDEPAGRGNEPTVRERRERLTELY